MASAIIAGDIARLERRQRGIALVMAFLASAVGGITVAEGDVLGAIGWGAAVLAFLALADKHKQSADFWTDRA